MFELQKNRPELIEFVRKIDSQKPRSVVLDITLSKEGIKMLENKELQSSVIVAQSENSGTNIEKSGIENLYFALPTLTTTKNLVGETETQDRLFTKAFLSQWPNLKNQIPKSILATPNNISIINHSDIEKNPQILSYSAYKNVFAGGFYPAFRDSYYLSNASMYPGVLIHAFLFEQLMDWQKYNYVARLITDNLIFIFFIGLVFWSFYVIISSYWQKLIYILFFWVVFFYMVSFRVFSINFGLAFLFLSVLVWSGENIVQNWLLKDILKRYTPTFLWNFIEDGQNLDNIEDYRDIAVMFSDIGNFTAKSEEDEDLMLSLLGECLELQSSIVFNNYGTVDKFIGDTVIAYWTGKDAVGNSLLTTCQIIQRLKQNEFISKNGIEIGMGINYGKANLKNFGSKENKNFTLFGDSVNITSRIENLNKIYQTRILITEDSINTVSEEQKKLFVFGQIDTIRPKGKKCQSKSAKSTPTMMAANGLRSADKKGRSTTNMNRLWVCIIKETLKGCWKSSKSIQKLPNSS